MKRTFAILGITSVIAALGIISFMPRNASAACQAGGPTDTSYASITAFSVNNVTSATQSTTNFSVTAGYYECAYNANESGTVTVTVLGHPSITASVPWGPKVGTRQSQTVTGTLDISSLPAGTYTAEATFTGIALSNGATADPVDVNFSVVGFATPAITLSPASVSATAACIGANTLSVSVSGSGQVTSNPGGISCANGGGTCSAQFPAGTTVSLLQSPNNGYAFSSWGGDCSGSGTCSVTMDANRSVSASFVNASVNGSCGTANGHVYASSDTGWGSYTFCSAGTVNPSSPSFPKAGDSSGTSWKCKGVFGGSTATCSATRNASLSVAVTGNGTVTGPNGFSCSAGTCSADFAPGASVSLSEAPGDVNTIFSGWGGACSSAGTGSSCGPITMNKNQSVTAQFGGAPGSITVQSENSMNAGTLVKANWAFSGSGTSIPNASCAATSSYANLQSNEYYNIAQKGVCDPNYVFNAIKPVNSVYLQPNAAPGFVILWDPLATMNVTPTNPSLTSSPSDPNPSTTITIANTGASGSSLNWSAGSPTYTPNTGYQWLQLSGTSGSVTAGNSQSLVLTVNPYGLSNGNNYKAKVTIGGTSSPSGDSVAGKTITVTLSVQGSLAGGPVVVNPPGGGGPPPPGGGGPPPGGGSTPGSTDPAPEPVGIPVPVSCSGGVGTGYTWTTSGAVTNTGSGTSFSPVYMNAGVYPITCTDAAGNSATVHATIYAVSCSSFAANPTKVVPPEKSTLSWQCTNAVSCTVNSQPVGNPSNGSLSVAPTQNTTYTLSCSGAGAGPNNTVTRSVQVVTQTPGQIEINP